MASGLHDGGRTLTQVAITQGAAGSLDLAAAVSGQIILVTALVVTLDAAGTLKFQENAATDLTGAMAIAANGGLVVIGSVDAPVLVTQTKGLKLNLVSTVGKALGWLRYFTAPPV